MDTSNPVMSDRDIVTGLGKKNKQAQTWLVDKYYIRLLRFLHAQFWQMLSSQDVEEIAWDTIKAVIDKISQFNPADAIGNHFRNWIFQMAKNKGFDRVRQSTKEPQVRPIADELLGVVSSESSDSPTDEARNVAVKRVLDQMAAPKRDVLILNIIHGFEPHEIGVFYGESAGTIRTRISRAKAELRDLILKQPEFSDWAEPTT